MAVHVIDLSGSLIEITSKTTGYLRKFRSAVLGALDGSTGDKAIIVTGGGNLARDYQAVYRKLMDVPAADAQDWIGIAATHLHGELVRHVFAPDCVAPLITDPTVVNGFPGRVMVASGWKPGFSTDYDAVLLAALFSANKIIKLSGLAQVYSADPQLDPRARPLSRLTWDELSRMNDGTWQPGTRLPFDPVAIQAAIKHELTVIFTGSDTVNLRAILDDRPYSGTTITGT